MNCGCGWYLSCTLLLCTKPGRPDTLCWCGVGAKSGDCAAAGGAGHAEPADARHAAGRVRPAPRAAPRAARAAHEVQEVGLHDILLYICGNSRHSGLPNLHVFLKGCKPPASAILDTQTILCMKRRFAYTREHARMTQLASHMLFQRWAVCKQGTPGASGEGEGNEGSKGQSREQWRAGQSQHERCQGAPKGRDQAVRISSAPNIFGIPWRSLMTVHLIDC